jgi:HAD domain in Swiss Army Knife RNA repair proteins
MQQLRMEHNLTSGRSSVRLVEFDPTVLVGLMNAQALTIFLDFDGVLHPEYEKTFLFCFMENFCDAVRSLGCGYAIVISSTWRLNCTLAELRSHFPSDVAGRVVGVTQDMQNSETSNVGCGGIRQREIQAWMDKNNHRGKWVAVDDNRNQFEKNCDGLFHVRGGGLLPDASLDLAKFLLKNKPLSE